MGTTLYNCHETGNDEAALEACLMIGKPGGRFRSLENTGAPENSRN